MNGSEQMRRSRWFELHLAAIPMIMAAATAFLQARRDILCKFVQEPRTRASAGKRFQGIYLQFRDSS